MIPRNFQSCWNQGSGYIFVSMVMCSFSSCLLPSICQSQENGTFGSMALCSGAPCRARFILCWALLIRIPREQQRGWSQCLSKPWSLEAQPVGSHPSHSITFPHVLNPNVYFQSSRVYPFQTEKCAQSCVSTLKIWVHSCSTPSFQQGLG